MTNSNNYIKERLEKVITDFVLNEKLNVFNIDDIEIGKIITVFRTKGVKGNKEISQKDRQKQINELGEEYLKKIISKIIERRQGFQAFWKLYKNDFLQSLKNYFEENENKAIYSWDIAGYFLNNLELKITIGHGYSKKMSSWFTQEPSVEEGDTPGNKQIYNLISNIRKWYRDSATDNPDVGYIVAASDVYNPADDFPKANGWKYTENSEEIDIFCKKQEIKSAKAFLGNIWFLIKKGLVNDELDTPVQVCFLILLIKPLMN